MTVDQDLIDLEYHRPSHRLYATLSPRHLTAFSDVPTQFVGLARLRLANLKSEGKIAFFEIYEDRLQKVWDRLKDNQINRPVRFLIAAGIPKLENATVDVGVGDSVFLSIQADATEIATWRPEWLFIHVQQETKRLGVTTPINAIDVHAAWVRASQLGERIERWKVTRTGLALTPLAGRPFIIRVIKRRLHIEVVINDLSALAQRADRKRLIARTHSALQLLGQAGDGSRYYRQVTRHLLRALLAAQRGPQSLGLELPIAILGGVVLRASSDGSPHGPSNNIEQPDLVKAYEALRCTTLKAPKELLSRGLAVSAPNSGAKISTTVESAGFRLGRATPSPYDLYALTLAKDALINTRSEARDIQAVTVCIDHLQFNDFKRRLGELRSRLLRLARTARKPTGLWQVNLQLFPFTRLEPTRTTHAPAAATTTKDLGWRILLVREMVGLATFRPDANWLSSILYPTFSKDMIEEALRILEQKNYVRVDPSRTYYSQTNRNIHTEGDVGGNMVVRYHEAMIEMASAAFEFAPVEQREFAAGTFAIDEETFKAMNTSIIEALGDLFSLAERAKRPDQIFQLNTQVLPLAMP